MSSKDSGNVRVAIRVRPLNNKEMRQGEENIIQMKEKTVSIKNPEKGGERKFTFDDTFWSCKKSDGHFAGQKHVYNTLGTAIIRNSFDGYNTSIFAYGQTSSGKSYTIVGSKTNPGLVPRVCQRMFQMIDEDISSSGKEVQYSVEASMIEIYNEKVRDLLNPGNKSNSKGLRVREHPKTGPYVDGLSSCVVKSGKELVDLLEDGSKMRTIAETQMNFTSSRAHTIFSITLTQTKYFKTKKGETGKQQKSSKINLIDLAGSERVSKTGSEGVRFKEGTMINLSLNTLGNVITRLAEIGMGKTKNKFVPYRDSNLTWLLKESLGGNSKTIIVACISPAKYNYNETLSTLKYANRAKNIQQKAKINEDRNMKIIRELREEIQRLKGLLDNQEVREVSTSMDEEKLKELLNKNNQLYSKLKESEDLIANLQLSQEEKEKETQKINESRKKMLLDYGLLESSRKKVPHIVNLCEDPSRSESLIYFFEKGITKIGKIAKKNNIVFNGLGIKENHCKIENNGGNCILILEEGSQMHINGIKIKDKYTLKHSDRLIFGNNFIFRFVDPKSKVSENKGGIIDWEYARAEYVRVQAEKVEYEMSKREKKAVDLMKQKIEKMRKELEEEKNKRRLEMEHEIYLLEKKKKNLESDLNNSKKNQQAINTSITSAAKYMKIEEALSILDKKIEKENCLSKRKELLSKKNYLFKQKEKIEREVCYKNYHQNVLKHLKTLRGIRECDKKISLLREKLNLTPSALEQARAGFEALKKKKIELDKNKKKLNNKILGSILKSVQAKKHSINKKINNVQEEIDDLQDELNDDELELLEINEIDKKIDLLVSEKKQLLKSKEDIEGLDFEKIFELELGKIRKISKIKQKIKEIKKTFERSIANREMIEEQVERLNEEKNIKKSELTDLLDGTKLIRLVELEDLIFELEDDLNFEEESNKKKNLSKKINSLQKERKDIQDEVLLKLSISKLEKQIKIEKQIKEFDKKIKILENKISSINDEDEKKINRFKIEDFKVSKKNYVNQLKEINMDEKDLFAKELSKAKEIKKIIDGMNELNQQLKSFDDEKFEEELSLLEEKKNQIEKALVSNLTSEEILDRLKIDKEMGAIQEKMKLLMKHTGSSNLNHLSKKIDQIKKEKNKLKKILQTIIPGREQFEQENKIFQIEEEIEKNNKKIDYLEEELKSTDDQERKDRILKDIVKIQSSNKKKEVIIESLENELVEIFYNLGNAELVEKVKKSEIVKKIIKKELTQSQNDYIMKNKQLKEKMKEIEKQRKELQKKVELNHKTNTTPQQLKTRKNSVYNKMDQEKIDKEVLELIPDIKEANQMAKELEKNVKFSLKIIVIDSKPCIRVNVCNYKRNLQRGINRIEFSNRLHLMRGVYNNKEKSISVDTDPFLNPSSPFVGQSKVSLSLLTVEGIQKIKEDVAVKNLAGEKIADLSITIKLEEPLEMNEECEITIKIKHIRNLLSRYANFCYVRFKFFNDPNFNVTEKRKGDNLFQMNFNYEKCYGIRKVKSDFFNYLKKGSIIFQVMGDLFDGYIYEKKSALSFKEAPSPHKLKKKTLLNNNLSPGKLSLLTEKYTSTLRNQHKIKEENERLVQENLMLKEKMEDLSNYSFDMILKKFTILNVMVLEAHDLKNVRVMKFLGGVNSFCKLRMNERVANTQVINDNSSPKWKRILKFKIDPEKSSDSDVLIVEVINKEKIFGNKEIGKVFIPIYKIVEFAKGEKKLEWFKIKDSQNKLSGNIRIGFAFSNK